MTKKQLRLSQIPLVKELMERKKAGHRLMATSPSPFSLPPARPRPNTEIAPLLCQSLKDLKYSLHVEQRVNSLDLDKRLSCLSLALPFCISPLLLF